MKQATMSEVRQRKVGEALGAAIASRREKAGLTQEDVAAQLGVGNQAISRMERGAVIPTVTRLFEFADVFGCRVEDFLRESSDRTIDHASELARTLDGVGSDDQRALVEALKVLAARFRERPRVWSAR